MSNLLIGDEIILSNIKGVIFDKDGTLIDANFYWSSMVKIRANLLIDKYMLNKSFFTKLLDVMGIDSDSLKIKKNGPVGIKSRQFIVKVISEFFSHNGLNVSIDEVEDIFLEADKQTSKNILPLLKLLPGVRNLLEDLNNHSIPMMIASTDLTNRARLAMEALKIDHFFIDILGGDSVEFSKPAPDLATKIITNNSLDRSRTVIIGDHPVDIQMGISANVGCNVGVLTGLSDIKLFEDYDCFIVNNLESLSIEQ